MNQILRKARAGLALAILLAAVAGFSSCEKYTFTPPAVDPNVTWKLSTDIQPIFNAKCVSCHGGTLSPNLTTGKSYNSLNKGNFVDLPSESSKLYVTITSSSHISRTIEQDRLKILYWIEQGAQNN